ncbi:hypothetical protein GGR52DRAFT_586075 [Hypoxylon sp. FL1284]|nr:hypothetical protein GGR52DRAFT_586075 [Hypoxylon sp. FL1284]
MASEDQPSHISALSTELLLNIFECDLPPSILVRCMQCCRRWTDLVSPMLYRHLVLTSSSAARWAACASSANDALVEALTLRMTRVLHVQGAYRSRGAQELVRRITDAVDVLCARLPAMARLASFSLYAPADQTPGLGIRPASVLALLDALPPSCVCLELSVRKCARGAPAHLCPAIRRALARLRFLRLHLPRLCPDAFGSGFDAARAPTEASAAWEPVPAPRLEQCVLVVADLKPPAFVWPTGLCRSRRPARDVLARHAQALGTPRNAPALRKLWIVDALPQSGDHLWFRTVLRRDLLADASVAIPYERLRDGLFVRMPAGEGVGGSCDVVSTLEDVKDLIEGSAWIGTPGKSRLPPPYAPKRGLTLALPEWYDKTGIWPHLLSYERRTGTRMLEVTEAELLTVHSPTFHMPEGWGFNDLGYIVRSEPALTADP